MKQFRSTIITMFIVCMVAASLIVPVPAAGSSSSLSDKSGDWHTQTPTVTPNAAPTTHPTTAPPPVTTIVPTPAPTTPVPTVPAGSIALLGAQSSTVTSSRLAMGALIHHGEFVDSQGNAWGGIPLWYLIGFMDDTVGNASGSHGSSTFNDTLAASGYTINITGKSGSSATFPSQAVARNMSYIIATTLNGIPIPASDPSGPYKLVGAGVSPAQNVGGVTTISLSFGSVPTPQPTPIVTPAPAPNGTIPVTPTPVPTIMPTISPVPPVDSATTLSLSGAVSRSITQSYLATGVGIGHHATYTDSQGTVWDGMPLWYFAGMVDDNVQHGPGAFNDVLATGGYTITVTGRDGKAVNLDSRNVARSNAYLIANKKNGVPIPYADPSAPFTLVGSGAGIGSGIQGVTRISVTSTSGSPITIAPTPTQPVTPVPTVSPITTVPASTSIQLSGAQSVTVSPEYFARGASVHPGTYTDSQGISWSGIPLWYLVGFADDAIGSASGHGSSAFNDGLADTGYTITVTGSSGSVTLDSKSVKRSSAYIIANAKGGTATAYTLVGNGVGIASGVQGVSSISLNLGGITPTPTPTVSPTVTVNQTADTTGWNISVEGKMTKVVTRTWFEGGVAAGHTGTYKDPGGKTWQGIPLWYFAGLADDNKQHGAGAYNDTAAEEGYTITIFGKDGKNVSLESKAVAHSDNYLIANLLNGALIPASEVNAPVAFVGESINSSQVIGGVNRIVLTFPGTAGSNTTTIGDNTKTGDSAGTKTAGGDMAADGLAGAKTGSTGLAISPIPTITIKISFTPLPEIVIQYGQPGLSSATGSAGTTTEIVPTKSRDMSTSTTDSLALTGAISDSVTVKKIQDGIEYGHEAEYTDAQGNTYKGMPLWFFAGWVDDENAHSAGAFNDEAALHGYNITVTGREGETMISGSDAMRNDGYLIATTKNGERLTADTGGPLMLVGNNIPSDYQVKGVSAIALDLPSLD